MSHAISWDNLEIIFTNPPAKDAAGKEALWNTPPFIPSPIYVGNRMIGANIGLPLPMELWIGQPSTLKAFRKRQLFPALALADACGLGMVALGASTPYACNYGRLPRPLDTPAITTGHAATAAMLKKWAIHASAETNLNFGTIRLAVFGAAGRLGKAVSRFIGYAETPKELILIDLPDKIELLKNLASLVHHCQNILHTQKRNFTNRGLAVPRSEGDFAFLDIHLAGPLRRNVGAPPARNLAMDVASVQGLLNRVAKVPEAKRKIHYDKKSPSRPLPTAKVLPAAPKNAAKAMSPLPLNGKCDQAMIDRIKAFQAEFLSIKPDGQIDANGRTWRKLLAVSGVKMNEITKKALIIGSAPVAFVRASVDRRRLKDMVMGHLGLATKNERFTDFLKYLLADPTVKNRQWLAYYLATVHHETFFTFKPVREVGKGGTKEYAKAVSVTDTHGYRGPRGKVYKNAYYGRGFVQLTHGGAYKHISDKIGLRKEELYIDPDQALEFETAYKILTYWMQNDIPQVKGEKRKLQDHTRKGILDYKGARAIVLKGDDEEIIAKYARIFEILLILSTRR